MFEYAVVSERSPNNFGAWVPDLDGGVSTGRALDEVKTNLVEAIEMHLQSLREHGEPVPQPKAQVAVVQIVSTP